MSGFTRFQIAKEKIALLAGLSLVVVTSVSAVHSTPQPVRMSILKTTTRGPEDDPFNADRLGKEVKTNPATARANIFSFPAKREIVRPKPRPRPRPKPRPVSKTRIQPPAPPSKGTIIKPRALKTDAELPVRLIGLINGYIVFK